MCTTLHTEQRLLTAPRKPTILLNLHENFPVEVPLECSLSSASGGSCAPCGPCCSAEDLRHSIRPARKFSSTLALRLQKTLEPQFIWDKLGEWMNLIILMYKVLHQSTSRLVG